MNNACLGNVMDFQAPDKRVASQYARPDFVKMSQGFGVRGFLVTQPDQVEPTLSEALALDEPVLVDVVIDDYPHFRLRG